MPSRNARHGNCFTSKGIVNLNNKKYMTDDTPLDSKCDCPVCKRYSKGYLRHLFKARELLAMRLCVMHNLYFYNNLMEQIRYHLDNGTFSEFKKEQVEILCLREYER
jgi:queuine tRNA-ribosyltransferase